ncbi:MAG: glutathione S-transferase family protein [Candidatus Sericytochromatia bacterium]
MTLRLLTIPFSHYCEKARWALDRAGLPYIEEGHLPLLHYVHNQRHGAGQTVPALLTPEGVLTDSSHILDYAHRHGIPLYPKEHAAEIAAWEERFNRILGPQVRVWAYWHFLPETRLVKALMRGCDPGEQRLVRPFLGLVKKLLCQKYGVNARSAQRALADLELLWSQCDRHLAQGRSYLVGERFTAADLTLAALGGVLLTPPEYGYAFPERNLWPEAMRQQIAAWEARPTGQHILRMYRQHRACPLPKAPSTALASESLA